MFYFITLIHILNHTFDLDSLRLKKQTLTVYSLLLLKAECESGGRLRQSRLDERRGDPPSLATVPPGHLSLGAVQQEGSQPGSADSLFGNAAYPRCRWAKGVGRARRWEDRPKLRTGLGGKPLENKGETLEGGSAQWVRWKIISDLIILCLIFQL